MNTPMPGFSYRYHLSYVQYLCHGTDILSLPSLLSTVFSLILLPVFPPTPYSRFYSMSSGLLCLLLAVRISSILMTLTVLNSAIGDLRELLQIWICLMVFS